MDTKLNSPYQPWALSLPLFFSFFFLGGGGRGGFSCLVVLPTHFNPNKFLLILLQIPLLFRCTPALREVSF